MRGSSYNLCSSNCTFVQLQFTARRCYAPDPAGGASSAPQTSWLDFGERKERRKGRGKERLGIRKGEGERKRKEKEVTGKRREEKEKGTKERTGGERKMERKEEKEKRGRERDEFCAVVIFP